VFEVEKHNLHQWALDFGMEFSTQQMRLFSIHVDELWAWNKRINLTGLKSRNAILIDLLLDSMIASRFLPDQGALLDVGSGAGFPGLVFKVCKPALKIHLLEPKSKKVSFLKQVIRLSKFEDIEVVRGRMQRNEGFLEHEVYGIITSKALADLSRSLKWCVPYLNPGGIMVHFFGGDLSQALDTIRNLPEWSQLKVHDWFSYTLPGKKNKRTLLILRKVSPGLID
jgi:16S rRNA (guanine527-N7)-methyltransferase